MELTKFNIHDFNDMLNSIKEYEKIDFLILTKDGQRFVGQFRFDPDCFYFATTDGAEIEIDDVNQLYILKDDA